MEPKFETKLWGVMVDGELDSTKIGGITIIPLFATKDQAEEYCHATGLHTGEAVKVRVKEIAQFKGMTLASDEGVEG